MLSPSLRERIERLAMAHGLRPKYHDRPVAREGSRSVLVRRELTDGEKVVALYGLGHRHLYWRSVD